MLIFPTAKPNFQNQNVYYLNLELKYWFLNYFRLKIPQFKFSFLPNDFNFYPWCKTCEKRKQKTEQELPKEEVKNAHSFISEIATLRELIFAWTNFHRTNFHRTYFRFTTFTNTWYSRWGTENNLIIGSHKKYVVSTVICYKATAGYLFPVKMFGENIRFLIAESTTFSIPPSSIEA